MTAKVLHPVLEACSKDLLNSLVDDEAPCLFDGTEGIELLEAQAPIGLQTSRMEAVVLVKHLGYEPFQVADQAHESTAVEEVHVLSRPHQILYCSKKRRGVPTDIQDKRGWLVVVSDHFDTDLTPMGLRRGLWRRRLREVVRVGFMQSEHQGGEVSSTLCHDGLPTTIQNWLNQLYEVAQSCEILGELRDGSGVQLRLLDGSQRRGRYGSGTRSRRSSSIGASQRHSDPPDLIHPQHLIPIVVDHLDGDLAG